MIWSILLISRISGVEAPAIENSIEEERTEMPTIQGNSLKTMSAHWYPKVYTLGSLIERIIHCESGGDPKVCNKEFGCCAGMGLFQLIPSTVKYCEEKLGREIDPFDTDDNTACAMWLLENEGTKHWDQSKECWDLL